MRFKSEHGMVKALLGVVLIGCFAAADSAPRYATLDCRGGGAMSAEYLDRPGSAEPLLTVRFVRATAVGELGAGQCRLRQGEYKGSDPTVLVYRARGERITQFSVAPHPAITGVLGAGLKRLLERIQNGLPFSVRVTNSGRGWWEVQGLEP